MMQLLASTVAVPQWSLQHHTVIPVAKQMSFYPLFAHPLLKPARLRLPLSTQTLPTENNVGGMELIPVKITA